jgi:hypothetical protein
MNPNRLIRSLAIVAGLLTAQLAIAQAPAGAPAGSTGLCNDGTYYSGAKKQGACRGHKGVKEWYGSGTADSTKTAAPATSGTSATDSSSAGSSAATSAQSTTAGSSTGSSKGSAKTPVPGGGPDKVWLNTASNVYHCPGTRYYGTTKAGAYMTEDEAKAKGGRPDHGKACK